MANPVLSNTIVLTATFDGKTYYSQIVPLNGTKGFFQFIDKETGKPNPSWENAGPEFFQKISDTDGGDSVPEGMPRLFWNGQEVTFNTDSSSANYGKSTGTWMSGCFKCTKKAVPDSTPAGSTSRWVFQIIKDIFGSGNVDSDEFYCISTIKDASGNPVPVQSEPQKVECIQTVSGSTVHVEVTGEFIKKGNPNTVLTATVYNADGSVNNVSGKWYKVKEGDDTQLVNGTNGYAITDNHKLTVPRDDVNGSALYRFEVVVSGKTYNGFCNVVDLNDPYHAEFIESHSKTPFVYGKINKGDTVTYTGHVVDNDGEEISGNNYTIAFFTRKKDGTQVVDGKSSFSVSYDDVVNTYQGEMTGYVTVK